MNFTQEQINAAYIQQYMQYMQNLQIAAQMQLKSNEEKENQQAENDKTSEALPEKKPIKLSFGIEAILSDSFGSKSIKVESEDSGVCSRSSSPDTTISSQWDNSSEADPSKVPSNNRRRNSYSRTIYSDEQLAGLEQKFAENKYIVGDEREKLALKLGLDVKEIKIWFQNRRIKNRRRANKNAKNTAE